MTMQWSRTPKHIMRTKCIEYVISSWSPASFIEFGSGTGDVTRLFLERGFYGKCYEISDENRQILKQNLNRYAPQGEVIEEFSSLREARFDYLLAFEVLEHVKEDVETLKTWSTYLKKGGKVLISVPAHQRKYSQEDEAVGHYRRYEKSELKLLLETAGYQHITILNYGFPLAPLTRGISKLLHRRAKADVQNLSPEQRSIRSGVERLEQVNKLSCLFNNVTLLPFNLLQILFFKQDWGDGYVAYAEKQSSGLNSSLSRFPSTDGGGQSNYTD